MFFKCEQFQRVRMECLVQATEYPGDGMGDFVGLHGPQQFTVGQFVAISIDQADHISELHQTDVITKIDEFLQPRLAEQVEHGEEELIHRTETGQAHPGHAWNGLLDWVLKSFLDRNVKGTLCPGQAVSDIEIDYPSPRLIDVARELRQVVGVQAAADFFAAGVLRPLEERTEAELLHHTHDRFAVSRRDHEIDVVHVSRAEADVERRLKGHSFGNHKGNTAAGEPQRHAYRLASKYLDLAAIPLQGQFQVLVDARRYVESEAGRDDVVGQHGKHFVPQPLLEQLTPIQGFAQYQVPSCLPLRVIDDAPRQ